MIDALENYFEVSLDRISRKALLAADLPDLIDRLGEVISAQEVSRGDAIFRVSFGVFVPTQSNFNGRAASAVLYADQLVMRDPVAHVVLPVLRGEYKPTKVDAKVREDLTSAIATLADMKPLIQTGALDLISKRLMTDPVPSPRSVLQALGGLALVDARFEPGEKFDSERERLMMAAFRGGRELMMMAWSRAAGAHYLGYSARDQAYADAMIARAEQWASGTGIGLSVIQALATVELPAVRSVDLAALARVRALDDDLDEWRATLRQSVRALQSNQGKPGWEVEAGEALDDALAPAAAQVKRGRGHARRLQEKAVLRLTLGAASGQLVAELAATSRPLALIGAGTGALSSFMVEKLFANRPSGVAAVLSALEE